MPIKPEIFGPLRRLEFPVVDSRHFTPGNYIAAAPDDASVGPAKCGLKPSKTNPLPALGRGSERVHRNQLLLFQNALEPDILSNSYAKDPPGLLWF